MVQRTGARDDTAKLLRDLLELWDAGSRLSASVVLHSDGTGRFAVEIEDAPKPAADERAKTDPDLDCSCCDRWVWCGLPAGHPGQCQDSETGELEP